MRLFLILISVLGFGLGCGLGSTVAFAGSTPESASTRLEDVQEAGDQTSDRAFDPFLFTVLGDCQHRGNGTTFFRSATNISYPAVGKDAMGRDVVIYVRLNLLADHTYWGQYSEDVLVSKSGSVTELQSTYFAEISGGWRIVGDKLKIDHLGEASMVSVVQSYPKAEFTFTSKLHDARVLGHKVMIGPVTTDTGPHGESAAEFCASK